MNVDLSTIQAPSRYRSRMMINHIREETMRRKGMAKATEPGLFTGVNSIIDELIGRSETKKVTVGRPASDTRQQLTF